MHLLFGLNIDEWISFAFWWITWGLIAWGLIEVTFQSGWTVGSFRCLDRGVSVWTPNVYSKKSGGSQLKCWFVPSKHFYSQSLDGEQRPKEKKNADYGISVLHSLLTLTESVEISEWKSSLHYRWDMSLSPLSVVPAEGLQLKEANCRSFKSSSRAILSMSTLVFFQLLLYNIWHLCCHSCWKRVNTNLLWPWIQQSRDRYHKITYEVCVFLFFFPTNLSRSDDKMMWWWEDFNLYPEFT